MRKIRIASFVGVMVLLSLLCIEFLCFGINALYLQPKLLWKNKFVTDVNAIADIFEPDDRLFWRLKKDHPEINSRGFRGKEFPEDFTTRQKVLFWWDSTVFGAFVHQDKTFCSLLQKKSIDYTQENTLSLMREFLVIVATRHCCILKKL
jgi:hypothetical protein